MHPEIIRHRDAIAELCRRHGVAHLAVFGSAARAADFDPARSDVDLLVEFGPEAPRSLAALFDLEDALSAILARPVDLVERAAVEQAGNPYRRHRILAEAEPLFPG
jgi:predicted nucleotidyltransferase